MNSEDVLILLFNVATLHTLMHVYINGVSRVLAMANSETDICDVFSIV